MAIIYPIIQCTWGFLQSFLGLLLFVVLKPFKRQYYHGAIVTYCKINGGVSLGLFIFISDELINNQHILNHEYGHTIQSLFLGPLYLLIIGIPSFIWANSRYTRKLRQKGRPYGSFYTEKSANNLANRYLGTHPFVK